MDESAFINAIAIDRFDWAPRLIYADWLEEQNDARSRWIREEFEYYSRLRQRDDIDSLERSLLKFSEELSPAWIANVGWRWSLWIDQLPSRDALSTALSTTSSLFGLGFDFGKLLNALFPCEFLRDSPLHRVLAFKKIAMGTPALKDPGGLQSMAIRISSTY